MLNLSDFMLIKEAAEYLGVTTETLRNWERKKKIKVYRSPQNNWRMYRKEDLDQLLKRIENSGRGLNNCINTIRRK